MAKRDYYEALEIDRSADDRMLKNAFRKLAMKYHPDRNPDDASCEQKFKEINEAYDTLKDPQKRAAYDRFGHAAFEGGGPGQAGPGAYDFGSAMSDIFDDFFGRAAGRRGGARNRGADLRYNLEISLEDAFHGKSAGIEIPGSVTCEDCGGSGARSGTQPVACPDCGGTGRVRASQGFFTLERTCLRCQGKGHIIPDPCPTCQGTSQVRRTRQLQVDIPRGIEDGTSIRLAGEGDPGPAGGPPGDLYLFVSIRPHTVFQRDGADLFYRVPLPMTTAALGGEIEVPSLDGRTSIVQMPEGTQTGRRFRLRGKGMPVLRSRQTGDLYVQVTIETPTRLTARQRELLAEFDAECSNETHPATHGFFAKVKDFIDTIGR